VLSVRIKGLGIKNKFLCELCGLSEAGGEKNTNRN